MPNQENENLRSQDWFGKEGKDGFIYILTDEQAGQLIRLEPM
jgi:glucose/arabinose dehydrogenase